MATAAEPAAQPATQLTGAELAEEESMKEEPGFSCRALFCPFFYEGLGFRV